MNKPERERLNRENRIESKKMREDERLIKVRGDEDERVLVGVLEGSGGNLGGAGFMEFMVGNRIN